MRGGSSLMLESLTAESFTQRLGERFRVHARPEMAIDVELIEANVLGASNASRRAPFSILFRGPLSPVWPQRTYRLDHDAMGSFDLFLVPVGPDATGMVYQAIFT